MTIEHEAGLASAIAAVRRVLDETEQEYRQMPFFVRPMVRRGFAKRTGHDFASWRALLDEAVQGRSPAALVPALVALAEHYRGAPARARRGMGANDAELREVERRSVARADAAAALHRVLAR